MFNWLGLEPDSSGDKAASGAAEGVGSSTALRGINLWDVANAVTSSVTNTVRQTAGEVIKSVQETDWKNEIAEFGREVTIDAQAVGARTAEAVGHLPELLDHHHAQPAQTGAPSSREGAAGSGQPLGNADVASALGGVTASLSHFGMSLISGAREIIDEVKDVVETEMNAVTHDGRRSNRQSKRAAEASTRLAGRSAGKYSRFESEVAALQRDSSTYCEAPEDAADYDEWVAKTPFSLEAFAPQISATVTGNAFMAELESRLVPLLVERHDFWGRYFYRLAKLQAKEEARQGLMAARAMGGTTEEELGWDDEPEAPDSGVLGGDDGAGRAPTAGGVGGGGSDAKDGAKGAPGGARRAGSAARSSGSVGAAMSAAGASPDSTASREAGAGASSSARTDAAAGAASGVRAAAKQEAAGNLVSTAEAESAIQGTSTAAGTSAAPAPIKLSGGGSAEHGGESISGQGGRAGAAAELPVAGPTQPHTSSTPAAAVEPSVQQPQREEQQQGSSPAATATNGSASSSDGTTAAAAAAPSSQAAVAGSSGYSTPVLVGSDTEAGLHVDTSSEGSERQRDWLVVSTGAHASHSAGHHKPSEAASASGASTSPEQSPAQQAGAASPGPSLAASAAPPTTQQPDAKPAAAPTTDTAAGKAAAQAAAMPSAAPAAAVPSAAGLAAAASADADAFGDDAAYATAAGDEEVDEDWGEDWD